MNPFFMINNPMMNIVRQVQEIKQNPNQLANVLKQRGLISEDQFAEVSKMGSNYEQIGQYLMKNGRMPGNLNQYMGQVNQIKKFL